ncbi:hypothetical protein ACWD5R_11295 [Streptomyces sp. NPDC002514]|uniref:hypothetical protein n=1 Tax=Streptomyces sp. NPDC001270 TaxID=3364554 RepID=UPI0036AD76DD
MSARRQIIAALSEDSMGGIATLEDVARAEQLVDAHRAEVLREAADRIDGTSAISAAVHATTELRRIAREKCSRAAADATPGPADPRLEHYVTALRSADPYALVECRDDLERLARAVMAVADEETDPVYRSGYATGRMHAAPEGWVLGQFTPVFTTSDGTDRAATELRCSACGGLDQGVGPHSLVDLMALASRHQCQPNSRKDGA